MIGYRIVFNREKMVVGWKASNCEYSSTFFFRKFQCSIFSSHGKFFIKRLGFPRWLWESELSSYQPITLSPCFPSSRREWKSFTRVEIFYSSHHATSFFSLCHCLILFFIYETFSIQSFSRSDGFLYCWWRVHLDNCLNKYCLKIHGFNNY